MKKILYLMLSMIILLCCIGCGKSTQEQQQSSNSKPSDVSQEVYDIGVKAVQITESYIATDLTEKEAADKLRSLEYQSFDLTKTYNLNDKETNIFTNVLCVEIKISDNISDDPNYIKSYTEIKNFLADLKNDLDIK